MKQKTKNQYNLQKSAFSETNSSSSVGVRSVQGSIYRTQEETEFHKFLGATFRPSIFENAFTVMRSGLKIIDKPYSAEMLIRTVNTSSIVKSCIQSVLDNVTGKGYRLDYIGPKGLQESDSSKKEFNKITKFLNTCNPDYTLCKLIREALRDMEYIGYGCLEVLRNAAGEISEIRNISSEHMYLTEREKINTPILIPYWEGSVRKQKPSTKKFRFYIQQTDVEPVVFKEFGDPRIIDSRDGSVTDDKTVAATELLFFQNESPGTLYGFPTWFSTMTETLGIREAALANYEFFKNNGVPAMVVMVSGGTLSTEAFDEIRAAFQPHTSRESMNRVVVLEASGDPDAASAAGVIPTPTMKLEPLYDKRQSDAMFGDYTEKNQAMVRQAYRISSILLGRGEEATYATAEASILMAEAQVFSPMRQELEEEINRKILTLDGSPLQYWAYRFNPSRIINFDAIAKTLNSIENVGGMNPNVAVRIINELLNLNLPMNVEEWGNTPFTLVKLLASQGYLKGIEEITSDTSLFDNGDPATGKSLGNVTNSIRQVGAVNTTNTARDKSND
jgi:PBSX family phage portal protein